MSDSHKVLTCACRCVQLALKLGNYLLPYRTPQCLEGPGQVAHLGEFLQQGGLQDVLVVTGAGMVRRGQVQPLLDSLDRAGIRHTLLTYDRSDPTSQDVELGYRTYQENHCQGIVAFGGGSRIDCAKAIAARAAQPKKTVAQLQGLLKVRRRVPPLVAIPTTAGAGSETTLAAVIIDSHTGRKASINDPRLIPAYAVLDAAVTVGLSPHLTAITGMDALTHAVEAYLNHTYNTPVEEELALRAVKLIHGNLRTAYENGQDLEARQNMQQAAFCAGRAFTRGCVGYVHALGHTLGSVYGIPHGLAMAVLLPLVLEAYGPKVHRRLAALARACGMEGSSDAALAQAFLDWIRSLNRQMGLPEAFPEIRSEDIPKMADWAFREATPLYPVPVIWDRPQLAQLLAACRRCQLRD